MSQEENGRPRKFRASRQGMAIGMAFGLALGALMGIALDNMAFMGGGLALGVALGMAFSARMENGKQQNGS